MKSVLLGLLLTFLMLGVSVSSLDGVWGMHTEVTKICPHFPTNNVDFICGYFEKDNDDEKGKPYLCRVEIWDEQSGEKRQETWFISEDEEYTYFYLSAGDEWDINHFKYELTSWDCSKITPEKVPVEVQAEPQEGLFTHNVRHLHVHLKKNDKKDRNYYLCQVTIWDEQSGEKRVKTDFFPGGLWSGGFIVSAGTNWDIKHFKYKIELQKMHN